MPAPASSLSSGTTRTSCSWQSMAFGNRLNGAGRSTRLPRFIDPTAATDAGNADDEARLQAHHSAWATCIFAGELAGAR